ncbi:MAG: acyl-CoA/acyl-ACP dehydrogenase [Chloroflexi bacterium]|nr:acyl-CoA/acyl-ACP dehydrogenase [Chloroflexota bacterium]
MDLALNETQLMLQSMAREFLANEVPKTSVRAIDESATGFSAELWRKIADLGWSGMAVPEEDGGTGNSLTDLGSVFEAMGEVACPSPLLAQVLAAHLVLGVATLDQRATLLPVIAMAERLFAVAITEPEYGWGAGAVQMRGVIDGDQVTMSGTKMFVPYAEVTDDLLVLVRTGDGATPEQGLTLVKVERDAAGIDVRRHQGWFGEPVCQVTFADARADVIGVPGEAWPGVEAALDKTVVLLSAFMLGGTQAALDMSVEYSKTRMAFGQPIGTFQRVQDLIIKALNDADAIRWTTYEALWKLDEGREDGPLAASMAKAVASEG